MDVPSLSVSGNRNEPIIDGVNRNNNSVENQLTLESFVRNVVIVSHPYAFKSVLARIEKGTGN